MKKIEAAIKEEYPYWRSNAKIDSKNIDYLLTTSETDKKFMRQSFWYDGEILVSGYPRNDVLYSDDTNKQAIKEKVYDSLGIDRNSKFILYVPTFRDDGRTTCFSLDYERTLKTFEEKYNCSIVLGTRFHPSNFDFANKLITYSERIINATIYPDIMELLIAADVVITDYSSCIFDFMHLKRPAFIFATDIAQYEKERGFYFPLEDTPFPIAQNNDELVENINNFDYPAYQNEIVKYMQKNGYADDGHASERIVDLIEKIIRER
jgi:CDP-glycerol glycerophosphotransferase